MTKLKNCPFCGGEADLTSTRDERDTLFMFVRCSECGARTYEIPDDEDNAFDDAIKQWNTRHDDWQTIETAPKDGTRVLVYNKGGGLNWEFKIQEPFVKIDWYRTDKKASGFIGFGLENVRHYKHTHWKPLPQPPQESE